MSKRRIFAGRYAQLSDMEPRRGGMSWVYPCIDLNSGNRVAVKVIEPLREIDNIQETIFAREMNVRDLSHPNIAALHGSGRLEDTGQFYLVFDWIDNDLKKWVEKNRPLLADDFVEQIALPLLSGLAFAHGHDVAHRDVKPSNVLITGGNTPQLADFGVSKVNHGLVESGPTVVDFVSRPFAPPEGHNTSGYSRDVFSFGVLLLWCLAEVPVDDYGDFRDAFDTIDASPQLIDLIEVCTCLDEEERPRTALEVYEKLDALQAARRENSIPVSIVHLLLTQGARRKLSQDLDVPEPRIEHWLKQDLSEAPAVRRLTGVDKRDPEEEHFFLYGSASRLHVALNPDMPSGVIVGASVIDEAECDSARNRNLVAEHFDFVLSNSIDAPKAITAVRLLLGQVEQFESDSEDALASREEQRLFDQWRLQLDAREAHDDRSAKAMRFKKASVDGFRLSVEVQSAPEEHVTEQRRRVVDDKNRFVSSGVIESVRGSDLILYLDRKPRRPVTAGSLRPDNSASAIKLRRERSALEAVRHQSSSLLRSELSELILHPGQVARANAASTELAWVQELDHSKREAVRAALDSEDFLVVEGPPGTGKTAFIAEVVAQELRSNPSARILVASQTNVALDNALIRIRGLDENISLLRIGNSSSAKISDAVMKFTIDEQLKRWREAIEKKSERYLKRLATRIGVPLDTVRASINVRRLASLQTHLAELDEHKAIRVKMIEQSEAVGATPGAVLTSDEIEELQDELRLIADRRKLAWVEVKTIRDDKDVVRLAGKRSDQTPGELQGMADSLLNSTDRNQIAPLIELHAEWIERLGRGIEFHEALLHSTQVTAATCIGFAQFPGAERAKFDLCIIDEASKATATETLVPLIRAERWILVGDDQQLPPFQEEALRSTDLVQEFRLDEHELHKSLFTRMYESLPEPNRLRLTVQYRMVDAIGDLISKCFYEGTIQNAGVVTPQWASGLQPSAVTWFDTSQLPRSGERRRPGESSYSNPCEVKEVVAHLKRIDYLLANQRMDLEPISVLLLAPYAAQVMALHRAVSRVSLACSALSVEVNTVDAAQGREADVLMFSATRCNERGMLGFVSDFARSNVALSRGRFLLSVFGDAPFFDAANGPLTDVIRHVRTNPSACSIEELGQ